MARDDKSDPAQRKLDEVIRRALATPPISNEEIERRSKKRRGRAEARPRSQQQQGG